MTDRPRRILVGYDGSEAAQRALDTAAGLAGYGTTLAVVTVAGDADASRRRAGVVNGARERLLHRQMSAQYLEPVGDPAEMLVEAARDLDADLLVVGRRRSALRRLVLGSVSSKVVRRAPCSVLVVH